MTTTTWDPKTYLQYADERSRPFVDLVARINAPSPRSVVDLGCGPGQLTVTLADRWPDAQVVGLDSSPEMIARAQTYAGPRVHFALGDIGEWQTGDPVDVIVSNAALQWVPDHRSLLPASWPPWRRRLAGLPGTRQLHRAEPRSAARAGGRARLRDPSHAGRSGRTPTMPPPTCRTSPSSGAGSTPGRPPTSTSYRSRSRVRLDLRDRSPARTAGAARRPPCGVRRALQGIARRGLPEHGVRDGAAVPSHLRRRPAGGVMTTATDWHARTTLTGPTLDPRADAAERRGRLPGRTR